MHAAQIAILIEKLYDIVLDENMWTPGLESISDACGGVGVSLGLFDQSLGYDTQVSFMSQGVRVDNELMRVGQSAWVKRDLNPLAKDVGTITLGQVMYLRESAYWEAFQRSAALHEFYRPNRIYPLAAGTLDMDQRVTTRIGIFHHRPSKALEADDVALLRLLTPHLQRVVQLKQRLAQGHNLRAAADEALDRLPWGVMLINRKGRVRSLNRRAEAIVGQADGLLVSQGQLAASRPDDTHTLRHLIDQVIRTTNGQGLQAGGALTLSRPSRLRPLQLLVSPVPRAALWEEASPPAALVFVSDPEHEAELLEHLLRRLYGFTPTESAMAVFMLQGHGLSYAAEQLGVRLNTAKTHQKRIFAKTGTHRQAELVRVLFNGIAELVQP